MFRVMVSLMIALVTASSVVAHAGSVGDAPPENPEMQHVNHLIDTEMNGDVHDGDVNHDGHASACMLGHCAVSCGVLIPSFSASASFTFVDVCHELSEHHLAGTIPGSDPPPPKA